jgi:hypothetical protein
MPVDDVELEDMTVAEKKLFFDGAPFSAHRIILSTGLSLAMNSLTPKFLPMFQTEQADMMEQFCKVALKVDKRHWDFFDLLIETFHLFYNCLSMSTGPIEPAVRERLIIVYNERLTMNFYVSPDKALTLMADLLPIEVYQDPYRTDKFKASRVAFESILNPVH